MATGRRADAVPILPPLGAASRGCLEGPNRPAIRVGTGLVAPRPSSGAVWRGTCRGPLVCQHGAGGYDDLVHPATHRRLRSLRAGRWDGAGDVSNGAADAAPRK